MVKQLSGFQKSVIGRSKLVKIECDICKAKRHVHIFSYCWEHSLCNLCANREERGDFDELSKVI